MINWGLIASMLVPNVGGWLAILPVRNQISRPDGKAWYQLLKKPSWMPPGWLFGPVWTVLYCAMGYASYNVYRECGGFTSQAVVPLTLYGGQLILNWTWTTVFYGLQRLGLSVIHLLVIDVAAAACTASFYQISPLSGYLMLPYLAWIAFATALNYSIWQLNKSYISME